ncbi:MAG TPA: amidohydrolase family protein [Kiritimatiellia bacterium]|nr:amidohydrolase family protein [Kiritimatiellia bacterium]HRU71050.1 amidohydrolase family protein [Kiritimatiellia bacterium]
MKTVLKIPGFIDLQVNGFVGVDFSRATLTEESFVHAARTLLERGTAAFLPTLITNHESLLRRNLTIIVRALRKDAVLARHILGFHLEGPFISREPGAVGAHDPAAVRTPSCEAFDRLLEWSDGRLRLMTIAAETPGADQLTRHAVARGVTVSCGHHLAGPDDIRRLVDAGASALTHLGNGMPNQVHRHNNPLLAGLAEERLKVLFIPDGHHLPEHVLKVFARAAGVDRLIATTDAASAAGLPPGTYDVLGNRAVLEPDGRLHNPEKQCLVGSSATMLACMNVLHALGCFSLDELLRVGFYNPLQLIGIGPSDIPTCKHGVTFSPDTGFALH